MRIAFLIRSLDPGGAERQLVQLAVLLAARGHEICVITYYDGGAYRPELERGGVRVLSLGKAGRWDLARPFLRLLRLLRSERPEVLHSYLSTANILGALAAFLAPSTHLVWGVRASDLDLGRFGRAHVAADFVERKVSWVPRLIISNSHAGREHAVRSGFPADRLAVVPNGIDYLRFRFDAEGRARVRREWNVGTSETLAGLVGRIDPSKGHEAFLEALSRLAGAHPDLRAVCVGRSVGAHGRAMVALAERLGLSGRLVWAGERHDMDAVYSALDLLCSASPSEGFSNVVGEAMSCGTLCVVTAAGDSAQLVGPLGIVAAGSDAASIAEALGAALLRPRSAALAEQRRQRIIDEFSPELLVDRTLQLLQRLGRSSTR